MTRIDELIEYYICGDRGYTFYQFTFGGVDFYGGYFDRRNDARRALKAALRQYITSDDILKDYLQLKANARDFT